jgi:hypothetical protein
MEAIAQKKFYQLIDCLRNSRISWICSKQYDYRGRDAEKVGVEHWI